MSRRGLTLVLVGCLGACATETVPVETIAYDPCQPIAIVPTADPSTAQREAMAEALAMWHAVLPPAATTADVNELPLEFEDAAPFFHGIYLPERGAIVINARLTDPHQLAITIAHELGHAFGLPHTDDSNGATAMLPGNLTIRPTERDARDLVALWGRCDPPALLLGPR